VASLTSHNPIGLHGLLRGYLYFFFYILLYCLPNLRPEIVGQMSLHVCASQVVCWNKLTQESNPVQCSSYNVPSSSVELTTFFLFSRKPLVQISVMRQVILAEVFWEAVQSRYYLETNPGLLLPHPYQINTVLGPLDPFDHWTILAIAWTIFEKSPVIHLCKEFPKMLLNPKFHYLIHESHPHSCLEPDRRNPYNSVLFLLDQF
jgi:hypothetical protein